MKEFNFKKIDAFATEKSDGNPAGYILLNSFSDITEEEMLRIAKELKGFVNEVGYVVRISADGFNLRYYSSEREVDFCGHATIAIMYDLIKNDPALMQMDILNIKTSRGELKVENRIEKENAVFIMAPEPVESDNAIDIFRIAQNLNIDMGELDCSLPVSIINAGLSTLLVPIKSLKSILSIAPEQEELRQFCVLNGVDIVEVFTDETADTMNDFRSRVFAPLFGYLEDPATGSGNSAFGYYLIKNGLWQGDTITIEQNGSKEQHNIVKLQRQADVNSNYRVMFGGGAVTRIKGKYILNKRKN